MFCNTKVNKIKKILIDFLFKIFVQISYLTFFHIITNGFYLPTGMFEINFLNFFIKLSFK